MGLALHIYFAICVCTLLLCQFIASQRKPAGRAVLILFCPILSILIRCFYIYSIYSIYPIYYTNYILNLVVLTLPYILLSTCPYYLFILYIFSNLIYIDVPGLRYLSTTICTLLSIYPIFTTFLTFCPCYLD